MSGDSLANIISLIPTFLALAIIAINMVIGLLRGFRKSVILSINYVISVVIGIVVFFSAISITYSDQLGGFLSSLGPDYAAAKSFPDVVRIFLETYLPSYAGVTNNAYLQQFIYAVAGLGVNLVLALICLVIIPLLIRFLLYIVYLIFFREGKFRSNKDDDGDDYKPRRLLGMAVGAARGVASTVLVVSFVTSFYFMLSGGITQNEKPEKIELFDNLSTSLGVDMNAVYQGIKQSRTTGVGLMFDLVKIDDVPIDLYYTDLFTTSTFISPRVEEEQVSNLSQFLSSEEVLKGEIAKLSLRAEGALLFELMGDILQTNAIKIVDGEVKVDRSILDSDIEIMVDDYINGSVIYSDLTPLLIIGVAEAINKGDIEVDDSIRELFTDETIAEIKSINFAKDLSSIFRTAITAAELIPVNAETDEFDFAAFEDKNTLLRFDVEKVKTIFDDLSKVKTLTKVVFPVGVGIAITSMEADIAAGGIDPTELDFSETNWSFEIKNLGNVYEKLAALDLDANMLLDETINEETGLSNGLQYIIDLCNDETIVDGVEKSDVFKENLTEFVDTTFESDLLSQIGLVVLKSEIAKLDIKNEDGTPSALNESFDMVKENLKHYTKDHLRLDLHELASSCLDITSLIPVFTDKDGDIFDKIYQINTEDARSALLGLEDSEGNRTGGIYDLRLFNGDLNGDGNTDEGCNFATDSLIENALITYGKEVVSPSVVDSVTTVNDPTNENYDFEAWPSELSSLIDAIADLQTIDEETLKGIKLNSPEITEIIPESMTNDDVDIISTASSKSILLSGIIKDKLVTNLKDDPTLGEAVSNPEIKWMDELEYDEDDNVTVKERGELNNILKAFIVFSDDEKEMNLDDTDSLINGLGKLLKPQTAESAEENVLDDLDYEDSNYFANSQVLMTVLSDKVSEIGNDEESGFDLIVPEKLNTNNNPNAWKDWSYDNETSQDRKKGEFGKLVLVLYHAREQARLKGTSNSEKPLLNQDNLLDSVIYMDQDKKVVDSLVLYATMSNELMKQENDDTTIIKVRECAMVKNPVANNDIKIIDNEIDEALDVIRYLKMDLTGNDFSTANLTTILTAIKDPVDGEATRKSICESNIFNISAVHKMVDNGDISVPDKYKKPTEDPKVLEIDLEAEEWYPKTNSSWADCELNRLLLSVCELNIEDKDGNEKIDVPSTNDLLKDLNKDSVTRESASKLDVVYESDVLSATINEKVEQQKSKGILIRDEAYDWDGEVRGLLKVQEIKLLSEFVVESGINLDNDELDAEHVFDKLINDDPSNDTFRKHICTSNILNITTVDKIGGNAPVNEHSILAFPALYLNEDKTVNKYKEEWYPADEWEDISITAWADCELNRLLIGIIDLEVQADGNDIIFPVNEKMDMLLSDSRVETDSNQTKLDVVYHSDIVAATISRRLNDTGGKSNDPTVHNVTMPEVKFNGNPIYIEEEARILTTDKIIEENEVELLLTGVMKVLKIKFDGNDSNTFEYDQILKDIEVSKLNADLDADLKNELKTDYPNAKTNLDVLLESAILHFIISDNLIFQNQKVGDEEYAIVTVDYFSDSNRSQADVNVVNVHNYVESSEISDVIKSLECLNIQKIEQASTIDTNYLSQHFGTQATNREAKIEQVSKSAIMGKIFSQILISNNLLSKMDAKYTENIKSVNEANDNDLVDIITKDDLNSILTQYGSVFDLLGSK